VKAIGVLAVLVLLVVLISTVAPAEEYVINPGDTISLTVLGEPDLTKKVVVDAQGDITLPLVNQVHVAGMTPQQATQELAKQLKRVLKNPQVSIDGVEAAKLQVTVAGEVKKPGILALDRGACLVDAITAAGGYTPTADLSKVSISHAGDTKPACSVDLGRFLLAGDTTANVAVSFGDTVFVPSRESYVVGMVSVLGAVRQSGQHPITEGMTVREAVMLAGGPTELADPTSVTLRHEGSSEAVAIDYAKAAGGDPASDPKLKPGDTIYFAPRAQLGYYTIQGGVMTPGRYELRGETSITEAIAIAGGARGKVRLNEVSILRSSNGGAPITTRASVGDIMAGKSPNVSIQNGDNIIVPAPRGGPDLLKIASVAASIAWILLRTR